MKMLLNKWLIGGFLTLMLVVGCGDDSDTDANAKLAGENANASTAQNIDVYQGNSKRADDAKASPKNIFSNVVAEAEKGNWTVFYERIDPTNRAELDNMLEKVAIMSAADKKVSDRLKGKSNGELFSEIMALSPEMGVGFGFKDLDILEENIADDGKTATLLIEFTDGSSKQRDTITMLKIDNKWHFKL